jgi:hypothetical protein
MRATCPAHLILLDSITLIMCGEENKVRSSSVCNFLNPPASSSPLGPDILICTKLIKLILWPTVSGKKSHYGDLNSWLRVSNMGMCYATARV